VAKYLKAKKNVTTLLFIKKDHAISTYLGITQQELAMLLGVTRTQVSTFE